MKFLFVVTNLAGGGAEKALLKLSSGLLGRGHQVCLMLLEDRRSYAVPEELRLLVLGRRLHRGWLGKRLMARRLARQVSELGPFDLLVSTLPFADEVVALAGLPKHYCRIANTLSREIERLAEGNSSKATRRSARYRDLYSRRPLIAVSHGVAEDMEQHFGVAHNRIATIPNPFDTGAILAAADQPADGLPERPYVIHVGRYSQQKRHDVLLDAWLQMDSELLLVLLVDEDPRLQSMIDARGLADRVKIAGFQPNPYPWIKKARLLVLCSDHEGLPNVLIEALLCGTPVVSTDCPSGPREILGDCCPEALVPCGDPLALATTMTHFLRNPPSLSVSHLDLYREDRVLEAYEALAGEN